MDKRRDIPTSSKLRGLGCGGKGTIHSDKLMKVCADCGVKATVRRDHLICPQCGGPLG